MLYLSPILSVEIDSHPLSAISGAARDAGTARGAPAESLDDLIEKIDIRLVSPAVVQVAAGAPTQHLCLIRLGLRLKIPDEIQVQWLRFSAEIFHLAGEGQPNRTGTILSFLPQRVTQDLAYDGRIAVDDSGFIQRSMASLETEGAARFNCFSLGYQTRPNRLVWDFIPRDGGPIPGSDNLLLAAKLPVEGETGFTETVQLCITHPRCGQGNFEYPPTDKVVRTFGTP